MEKCGSYVYFSLSGDDFDTQLITDRIGIVPTSSWRKGDKGKYGPQQKFSSWTLSSAKGLEYFDIGKLVDEIVNKLFDKIEIINELKKEMQLNSVLNIVLDIDTNPEKSTPAIGYDLKTIEFLYKTNTVTEIDIYRFDSQSK